MCAVQWQIIHFHWCTCSIVWVYLNLFTLSTADGLLGNFQFVYLIYVPVGIFTGLAYSLGLKRGYDKQTLMLIAILTYVVGEVIATFIVYPMLGFPIATMIEEYKLALTQTGSIVGFDYSSIFTMAGVDFNSVIIIVYIIVLITNNIFNTRVTQ